jgi:hypothetical protein
MYSLLAESAFERDFKQLKEQREKAIAAANEPINRRYQAGLEQLLKRATAGNDLETAIKIKDALAEFSAPPPAATEAAQRSDLRKLLTSGPWNWWNATRDFGGAPNSQVKFLRNGKCETIPKLTWVNEWEVTSPTQLKVFMTPERYWIFNIDLAKQEGVSNPELGTLKDSKAIKFVGLAK